MTARSLLRRLAFVLLTTVVVRATPASPPPACGDSSACSEPFLRTHDDHQRLDLMPLFETVAGDHLLLEDLRNCQVGGLKASAGGELRYRYMDEKNRLRPPGPGQSQYDLWRFTPFVSVGNDFITGYLQAIDASIFELDPPYRPVAIDENRADLLRFYVDLRLLDSDHGSLTWRYGRQFLKYGSQRLLSPLAWSNTYRNFEGHKLIATYGDWQVDAFAVQSVNGAAGNLPKPTSFDHADQSRWLLGVYSTWTGRNDVIDLYYLFFDETQSRFLLPDGTRHTLGMRAAGHRPVASHATCGGTLSWDLEGAWQFGEDDFATTARRDVQAGMLGALGGWNFDNLPGRPGIGGIFYWASGDDGSATGDINTFFSPYPLGHAYWGQIDNFGGMNLLDYGLQTSLKPHEKLNLVAQWHWFELDEPGGAIINIAGVPLPGSGDRHIGNELDLVGTLNVSESLNVQAGYFWFFYGDAVNQGPLARPDAEQFYLQVNWTF